VSIGTPIALAPEYGASLHAAIRYYVLHHPDPVSVLVAGRYQNRAGGVPVWEGVDSPSFLAKFGMLADRIAGQLMIGGDGQPLGDIAMKAMSGTGVAVKDVIIPDINGEWCLFIVEAFYNYFYLFVMSPRRRLPPGSLATSASRPAEKGSAAPTGDCGPGARCQSADGVC
jgi:hypothetical protein